jgi:uncharacterized LabA/DUF88 family protein
MHQRYLNAVNRQSLHFGQYELSSSDAFRQNERLLDTLEMRDNFALRLGQTKPHGWRLGSGALRSLRDKPREITPADLVPNTTQKGVDLRLGLDIARLSLTNSVQAIVVVSGDSDLVPAFKFARREGVRVYLDHLKHGVMRDLKAHADIVLDVALTAARAKAKPKPRVKLIPQIPGVHELTVSLSPHVWAAKPLAPPFAQNEYRTAN